MELVGIARVAAQLLLDVGERVRVDQLAQLLLAEQLAQQVAVERERLGAPLGRRRVVLVHVGGDVVEEERARERGRGGRLHLDQVELARLEPVQDPLQRRQVEDVLEALAVGLEHDREGAVLARDLEQVLGLQALLPERRALAGTAPRDQQSARGVLAEARAEESGLADLADDELLDLVRADQQVGGARRRVGLGEVERDPVVRPDRLHVEPERLAQAGGERHPPGRVHAAAERRQDADAPVADLVAEALDDDRAVGGDDAGRRRLLAQEREQVLRRARVEVVVARAAASSAFVVGERDELARSAADLLAELVRAADALALPERHDAGHARGGRDDDAVAGDLLDPPGRGAEHERLALTRLVDHLLVELADATTAVDRDGRRRGRGRGSCRRS